jgi:hypothetical protein
MSDPPSHGATSGASDRGSFAIAERAAPPGRAARYRPRFAVGGARAVAVAGAGFDPWQRRARLFGV